MTDEEFGVYCTTVEKTLEYYHKQFDIYFEYSGINNLCTVNKNAGIAPVKVDAELIDFLLYCKELFTLTNGKTNVMLGSVLRIWHDHREAAEANPAAATVPETAALEAAALHTSIDLLVIDEAAGTVYVSDPEASIDVGAIGKGYVTELLYKELKAEGIDRFALNIGGNLRTIGKKADGSDWTVGITNPDKSSDETLICRVRIGDTALVTSGDYERYFVVNGEKYHHIIDPATRMPADHFSAVSIFTPDSALADALSTALFCMSYEDGLALVEKIGGVDVIWITKDYTIKMTDGVKLENKFYRQK
jgi:thiamine biosynthesis lipoprotein